MLLSGGTLLDIDGERRGEVRVGRDGRVAETGPDLMALPGEEVVDASGMLVVPGGVDAHTHLHLPVGSVQVSDDFVTGTIAAAMGGTTTVIDYVTAYRGEDPIGALGRWKQWAEPSYVDWGLHMTFTESVSEQTVADCVAAGVTSFKLYMAYPELLQVDDGVILDVMRAAGRHGGLVTIHCENGGAIEALRRQALAEGRSGVIEHATTRPAVLEGEATGRAALLAELADCPVYVVHVSSAPALEHVRAARSRGIEVLAETCPQYLYLNSDKLAGADGADFVCTPPLRDPWHTEELWEGLARGSIHTVATDHCPFSRADRRAGVRRRPGGYADFTEIPGGLPGIETRMALVWQGVAAGRITRADWVRLCAEAPAKVFGLWPLKGSLRRGFDADIVVWDPTAVHGLDATSLHMATDHSPYAGMIASGWPALVYSRGRLVVDKGQLVGERGAGHYLSRAAPLLERR
ncbi:MAG: dihydropyrimidinase [Acidimicrobiales bacterium]